MAIICFKPLQPRALNEVVKVLLDHGADINPQTGTYGNALQAAAYGGHVRNARLIFDRGSDINMEGRGEERHGCHAHSGLHEAVKKGHEQMVRLLLERGAKVNAKGGKHGSALKAALRHRRNHIKAILLAAGATAEEPDLGDSDWGPRYKRAKRCPSTSG
ncbi:ankyrin repeat-containing domain protein [Thelonectria olida]|uniref:Ankyrin repeat-containing domain protein n=1 Tax=Thelonectria olida TaxID=1576542 RepID=A0A9P8W7S6_9HYPO|nr:ankyrin repeat-containing domain protein [Thelonectria olida]